MHNISLPKQLQFQVIVVAPNFRVSVLGNLYIEGEAPGNQMLRDQVTHEGIEVNLKEFYFEDFKCFNR